MFTGIIEAMGTVERLTRQGTNLHVELWAPFAHELKVDQSVAHNGACLTVVEVDPAGKRYAVTAVAETLAKTNLADWQVGSLVNLERCLQPHGRLDGHFVLGHVDAVGTIRELSEQNGSWRLVVAYPTEHRNLLVEKGSAAVNGISLTVFNVTDNTFEVAVIPYTYEHTNLHCLSAGDAVNLEFDMIGKYVARQMQR